MKLERNSFESVSKLSRFSFSSLCGQFKRFYFICPPLTKTMY